MVPDDADRRALARSRWFASCEAELQAALCALGHSLSLVDGELLFHQGQLSAGLCCVLSGALEVGRLQPDGTQSLLAWLEGGHWFGEISLLDGQPRTHDVRSDGPSRLWLVPEAALVGWLEQHPRHWRSIARLACAKLRQSFEVLEDIARLPLEARLAKRLLQVAQGYGEQDLTPAEGTSPRRLRLPQEQLALMMGVSRQTVNKALKSLEAQGAIALRYGGIELLEPQALAALGQNPGHEQASTRPHPDRGL
ncbi:Crp/Fnr family transcriptional regulator [Mitsuaria sp. WAJ17]|uniref:Crp/Fnr family transcriptional regulator n=1 Tax=Mitsuaria sp. WAJ17 TaxID=2761452 RepID=UPI0016008CED|nr:Crp/Fnr family transcriptional regulator [Mitsuaria sp. WAJ17]MBB2485511.1 Crp/Fnr family transcriptional regulator [Mitsuaria sp. WAJ17]